MSSLKLLAWFIKVAHVRVRPNSYPFKLGTVFMKIKSVEVVRIERPGATRVSSGSGTTLASSTALAPKTKGYRKAWPTEIEVANPMSKFPRFKSRRQLYGAKQWPGFGVKVTAEDGTWG
ncbi:MAG: hypothetical protein ACI8V2_002577, partial [Candidatus Latescibacterota bacterium]